MMPFDLEGSQEHKLNERNSKSFYAKVIPGYNG